MLAMATSNYPNATFKSGDVSDSMLFTGQSFTHILCLYFTVYQIEDKSRFFHNVYDWLMPGGVFILHLVDREMFDPIVPGAASLMVVSPQKYADKRITDSSVEFDTLKYKASFNADLENDKAVFEEKFVDKGTGKVRRNEHVLYIPTQESIIATAKDVGFILTAQKELQPVGYEYQYLYTLQKPQ